MTRTAIGSARRWRGKALALSLSASMALSLPLSLAAAPAGAAVLYRLNDPALAARIDGAPVQAFSVDAVWRLARRKDPQATRSAALEQIIVNRLLAGSARQSWGEAVLFAGQRVAFAHEVALDDQLVAVMRSLYGKELEHDMQGLPGGGLSGLVTELPSPDAAALDAVFGKAGQLKLEYALTPDQLARAQDIALLRYRLPGGAANTVTLADVYRRQNVQGRVALFSRQAGFAQQQARLALAAAYVRHWSRQRFGDDAVADLRRVLAEQDAVQALRQLHGIGNDVDAGSPVVRQLAARVGAADIAAYYRRHRDEFLRIEKVKARHIRLGDEKAAQAVVAALAGGGDFAALARRYSTAPDGAGGGDLGWIVHGGKADWLAQTAFAQDEGKPSPAMRTPVGPNDKAEWEIVLVERRVQGYQDPASETVRYVAANAVAREQAVARLAALRRQLLQAARIEVNRSLLERPLRLMEETS